MPLRLILFVLLSFTLFTQVNLAPVNAQSSPTDGYFLAPDSDGVIQVWHWGDSPTMLTSAAASIVDFAVSHDRLSVVYTSDGKLWLDPVHDVEPYVIADLDPESSPSTYPVFSPDDQLLAYSNHGIWIYGLDGTAPRQIIENIRYDGDTTTDVMTLRYYYPEQFMPDSDWLRVTVGIWEGRSPGLLNIETGESVELDRLYSHDKALPLTDGRLLVYGNNAVGGVPNVEVATMDNFNTRTVLFELTEVTTDTPVFVSQIEEIEPGLLRVLASTFGVESAEGKSEWVTFDYDLRAEAFVGGMQNVYPFTPASIEEVLQSSVSTLSPDGRFVTLYRNAIWDTDLDKRGIVTGELILYELATGEMIPLEGFESVSSFRW